jgi:hypothetical protein
VEQLSLQPWLPLKLKRWVWWFFSQNIIDLLFQVAYLMYHFHASFAG